MARILHREFPLHPFVVGSRLTCTVELVQSEKFRQSSHVVTIK
jgi:hypothetical protein